MRILPIRKTLAALSAATAVVAAGAFAGTAHAEEPPDLNNDPFGVVVFGGDTAALGPGGTLRVPRGTFQHVVRGEGLEVREQEAGFVAAAPVCNWKITFELRDLDMKVLDSRTFEPGSRCDGISDFDGLVWEPALRAHATWNKKTVPGYACAVLKVGNSVIAQQCHQIAGQ